jgi:hypothetical protein
MASERAKKLGKRIIAYPEDQPSVLSSKDWINNLFKDPKLFVSQSPSMVPSFPFNRNRSSTILSDSSQSSVGLPATVSAPSSCICSALIDVPVDVGWLTGDVIAGLTVGIVVVPQSMSYAQVNCTSPSGFLQLSHLLHTRSRRCRLNMAFTRLSWEPWCIACVLVPNLSSFHIQTTPSVVRHSQGCFHRPSRSHVSSGR